MLVGWTCGMFILEVGNDTIKVLSTGDCLAVASSLCGGRMVEEAGVGNGRDWSGQ